VIDSSLLIGRKNPLLGYQGGSTSGCLMFLIFASLLGFVGFKVGSAYWNYFEVRHKTQEVLNWAVAGTPKPEIEIAQRVIVNVRLVGVELPPENIKIKQTADTLTIIAFWVHQVEFPYYTLPLNFKVTLSEEKRWHKGGLIIK